MNDERWYVVMNLLYPSVLGTLIYTGFDNLAMGSRSIWGSEALLALALFVLYVMDYAHSVREENRKAYSPNKFWTDLVIVACLFFAGKAILGDNIFPSIHPAWWLFGTKAAAITWECWGQRGNKWSIRKRVEVETDTAFALVYLTAAVSSWITAIPTLVMAGIIAADAYYYYKYEWLIAQTSKAALKAPPKPRARRGSAKAVTA